MERMRLLTIALIAIGWLLLTAAAAVGTNLSVNAWRQHAAEHEALRQLIQLVNRQAQQAPQPVPVAPPPKVP